MLSDKAPVEEVVLSATLCKSAIEVAVPSILEATVTEFSEILSKTALAAIPACSNCSVISMPACAMFAILPLILSKTLNLAVKFGIFYPPLYDFRHTSFLTGFLFSSNSEAI